LSFAWRQIRLCLDTKVPKSSYIHSANFLAFGLGSLGFVPMIVIALGLKSQIELSSNFTYYIGAPVFCITLLTIIIVRFRFLLLGNYHLTIALISFIALFQLTQNYYSANAVTQKYSYLRVAQLAITNPGSLLTAEFCRAKTQILLNDYAGLGKSVGEDLENHFYSNTSSKDRCQE
jgi:hypothetical protein